MEEAYSLCYEDRFTDEDVKNRRIYINGEINEHSIDNAVYHILRYNRIDKQNNVPIEQRTPIIIYINSPGGNVIEGWGVIDAILTSETPVYTVNQAECASMGFLIFIAGAKRYAMPHSQFLMHDGIMGGFDSTSKMQDLLEFESTVMAEASKKYIISRTRIDELLYNAKRRCEWYFMPDEGKKIGVVDFIVGEDCPMSEIV